MEVIKYITIEKKRKCDYYIKIERMGHEIYRRRFMGYTKKESEQKARQESGTTGEHLTRIEF